MSTALVLGVSGQDGRLLAAQLLRDGMTIWGASRAGTLPPNLGAVRPVPAIDLRDQQSLSAGLAVSRPDEIYHLAAQSSVARSRAEPAETAEITGVGVARLLEAARQITPRARIFIPTSSEILGVPDRSPQDETPPPRPISPYTAPRKRSPTTWLTSTGTSTACLSPLASSITTSRPCARPNSSAGRSVSVSR